MTVERIIGGSLAVILALLPAGALAQGELAVTVETSVNCNMATFQAIVEGGASPYSLTWDFGDSELLSQEDISGFPIEVVRAYPSQGEYSWILAAMDAQGATGKASGTILIEGPSVNLVSDPFPPLLILEAGSATASFTAEVEGGQPPYNFVWDLNGDGQPEAGGDLRQAAFTYTQPGEYLAMVRVEDACGLVAEDTLPVVVIDPEQAACHPMAQRIADAVNTLFPSQAGQVYTCEEIYDIFTGGLTGSQVGFGRMWHAYQLSLTIQDLTWEEIRDWHLDGNGWGLLVQLDRFAETLDQIGIRELIDLVTSGEASVNDIRTAVRAVVRYEADFNDALARLTEGASPGALSRFYRTAQELGLEPGALDEVLAGGVTLNELGHAARFAERTGADWSEVAQAHASGFSWGEIGQAERLAGEGGNWMDVLQVGVREFRNQLREQTQSERSAARLARQAESLAGQYGRSTDDVLGLYHGACAEDWKCVREQLRDQSQSEQQIGQNQRTAERLAGQYGVSATEVLAMYDGTCQGDWSCVRAALRQGSDREPGRQHTH